MIVFDTSFLVALANEEDAHHQRAARAMERFRAGAWGEGLLPEYVFMEYVTVLMARRDLAFAEANGAALLDARELTFVPSSDHFLETWARFRGQAKGKLSFADAAVVVVALARGAEHVATFDDAFRRTEGFAVVP